MSAPPAPEPEERDASAARRVEEDATRYPRHEDPDDARERAGLDDDRAPSPDGAPEPAE